MIKITRILLTGDIHGQPLQRFSYSHHPSLRQLTFHDVIFVLGDFGLPFGIEDPHREQNWKQEELYYLNWLNEKPWTTIALRGNHDDINAINLMPQVELFDGIARQMKTDNRVYNNIYYIDQPTALEINNTKLLCIPGARSHDISDGILNPDDFRIHEWRQLNKMFRIRDYNWWDDEPVDIAATEQLLNQLGNNYIPDYILTHEAPMNYFARYDPMVELSVKIDGDTNNEEKYLSTLAEKYLDNNCRTIWFHGHHHIDRAWTEDTRCIYKNIYQIEGEELE